MYTHRIRPVATAYLSGGYTVGGIAAVAAAVCVAQLRDRGLGHRIRLIL